MLINSIELEDWKSYRFAKIALGPGVTAILGENGAGKSSILEAIGFALFNHTNGKLEDLLRERAKSGRVAVSLTSSLDGADYVVEREFTAKTTTRYRVHQVEQANQIVAEGVSDVQRWLRSHMGVPPDAHLGTLFANTIGVPQNTFTAPFLLAPAQRKAIFNPLLRVEEYKKASDNLRPTVGQLKDDEVALNTEIARIEGILTVLPGLREEKETLVGDEARLGTVRGLRRQQLDEAEAKLKVLAQAAKVVEDTHRRVYDATVRQDAHEGLCESAMHSTDEAKKAAQVVEENLVGYEAYIEAEAKLQELEASQQEQARLLAKRGQLEIQVTQFQAVQEQEQRDAEGLLQSKASAQEIKAGLEKAQYLEMDIQGLQTEIDRGRESVAKANEAKAGLTAEWKGLKRQSVFLVDTGIGTCPTCGSELTADHHDEIMVRNSKEMSRLTAEAQAIITTMNIQVDVVQELVCKRLTAQAKLREFPSEVALERAQQELTNRKENLVSMRNHLGALAQAPGDLKQVDIALEPFAGLAGQLSLWRARRGLHKRGHTLYLGNLTVAQLYPDRQAVLDELLAKHKELQDDCAGLTKEYQEAKSAYNAEEHTKVQAETTRVQQELAGVIAQLKEKRYRLTVVKDSIQALEGTEKELAAKRAMATETSDLLATIETVREILREAGPYVTRRLVRQISQGAAAIFGDLTGDPGRRLQWTEDYQVLVEERGYNRTFAKHSGGERMLIALAIRLAMLREISAIDVAFFDEPTDSLSRTSCESLADAMSQIKGFSQLFVITHDSTFESAAENSIRIVNDERGSHVSTEA